MNKRFQILMRPFAGAVVLQRKMINDERGFFERMFCAVELAPFGWTSTIKQVNHTLTKLAGSVRGMHLQLAPHSEHKLVSCTQGEVFDVVVDLRKESPTFLHWHGEILSAENGRSMLIPPGCAHGFQTLSADVEMFYCHDQAFAPEFEFGIHPADSKLNIIWPLAITNMSEKDQQRPYLMDDFTGVEYAV
jgi:dTDP-4-dehydrorhamnose 3,5-epimerase